MYIGIDLGTSSVKGILIDEFGTVIASKSLTYPIDQSHPLWSEQNPSDWLKQTSEVIQYLLKFRGDQTVQSIALSGQMHGLVILDEHDQVIRPAILWNDQRSVEACHYLNKVYGMETLKKYVQNQALVGFTAPKLLWMKEHEPDLFHRIHKIMLPKDYIIYQLTGVHATDHSDASGTLFYDVVHQSWSKEMMEVIGLPMHVLPKLYYSNEIVGILTRKYQQLFDITTHLFVVAGGADNACAAIGTHTIKPGQAMLSLGTSGVIYMVKDTPIPDSNLALHLFQSAHVYPYHMGVILSAAKSLEWWIEDILDTSDYALMIEQAIKEENELLFLPYLSGERTPINDPYAKGAFVGITTSTKKHDFTRAVLEGVIFALKQSVDIFKSLGTELHQVTATGGGAKSDIWCQMIADVFEIDVMKINAEEGPAYGAAILAYQAMHPEITIDEIGKSWIHIKKQFKPNKQNAPYYRLKYKQFSQLYPQLKSIMK